MDRYTNGESSSVRVEKAQELVQSITYSIGVYLKSIPVMQEKIELIKQEKISDLFIKGMDKVELVKNEAWLLLMKLQKNCISVNNIAYHDTIAGIKDFFHDYNIEFGAQDIPGSIDYPLLHTIPDLLGVEYIYEYLQNFTIENDFLGKFSPQAYKRGGRYGIHGRLYPGEGVAKGITGIITPYPIVNLTFMPYRYLHKLKHGTFIVNLLMERLLE